MRLINEDEGIFQSQFVVYGVVHPYESRRVGNQIFGLQQDTKKEHTIPGAVAFFANTPGLSSEKIVNLDKNGTLAIHQFFIAGIISRANNLRTFFQKGINVFGNLLEFSSLSSSQR